MSAGGEPLDLDSAQRVLGRVSHAQRFPVGRFVPPVGLLASSVRGLAELQMALRPEARSLPGVDFERLADWIEREVGDGAGAAAVRAAVRGAPSYVEACMAVHERIAERVASARRLVAAADGDRDPDLGIAKE